MIRTLFKLLSRRNHVSEGRDRVNARDISRLCSLFADAHHVAGPGENAGKKEMERFVNEHAQMEVSHLFGAMMEAAKATEHMSALSEEAKRKGTVAHGETGFGKSFASDNSISAVDEQNRLMEQNLLERTTAFVRVDKSSIDHPAAGEGVFLRGEEISAGRVIAMYPGIVYFSFQAAEIADRYHRNRITLEEDLVKEYENLYGAEGSPNPHAIQQFTGDIINARDGSVSTKLNHYAVGHKINHPPKGKRPNVMICPFNFESKLLLLLFMDKLSHTS
mmetsp:Transcript_2136/g.4176  ORF Transcript_2136/g.4176 Transcript_2136/m.4176 type:complete len:276 (-) Transcript_2136:2008-2835(-)